MDVKAERKKDAQEEGGHIYELKNKGYVIDKDFGEDYVFISYSSKDWEKVLYDIVYETCKNYGLRVYFDTNFDDGDESWITQFEKNMKHPHCKAVFAFVSPNYKSSYATLMELLAASVYRKPVLPIVLNKVSVGDNFTNTGLGTQRYSNCDVNELWEPELMVFNNLFFKVVYDEENTAIKNKEQAMNVLYTRKKSSNYEPYIEELSFEALKNNADFWDYKKIDFTDEEAKKRFWDSMPKEEKKSHGEEYLIVKNNARLIEEILANMDKNSINGINKDYSKALYDKLTSKSGLNIDSVFSEALIDIVETPGSPVPDPVPAPGLVPAPAVKACIKDESTPPKPYSGGYTYTIFGKEYTAEAREQGKLMFDAFEALIERYPDCAEKLTQRTSVAKAEDVKNANTKESDPTYFRGCKSFMVGNQEYLVGTSYGFKAKLAEIKGMFKICGANPNEFILNGDALAEPPKSDSTTDSITDSGEDGYIYTIFGKEYTAGSRDQGKLMYDAFEALIERYPDCAEKLTQRTSIARAENVKNANTKESDPTYFRGCKSFMVGNQEYLVGTSYGFDAKMAEIKGMFKICEEDFGQFVIVSAPQKSTRSTNGKKGIGELI